MAELSVFNPTDGGGIVEPSSTQYAHVRVNGGCATCISRTWDDKEFRSCGGLCPESMCSFEEGTCLVAVPIYVPPESCALFRRT